MRSSRKRAVDGFLRAFSGVDARSIGRECRSFRAFETSCAFCLSLKPQSRSPPIIRLFRLAHHSPRLVLLRPPISRRENCRQGPKLAPVLERRRRVQNVPRRYRLGLRTNRLAHQAHRKLDRALASEQKRLLHDERLEDAARQTRATAKVLGEERSGKVQNDHERVGVEDEVRRKKNERLYST